MPYFPTPARRKIPDLTGWGGREREGCGGQLPRALVLRQVQDGGKDSVACDYIHWADDRMLGFPQQVRAGSGFASK